MIQDPQLTSRLVSFSITARRHGRSVSNSLLIISHMTPVVGWHLYVSAPNLYVPKSLTIKMTLSKVTKPRASKYLIQTHHVKENQWRPNFIDPPLIVQDKMVQGLGGHANLNIHEGSFYFYQGMHKITQLSHVKVEHIRIACTQYSDTVWPIITWWSPSPLVVHHDDLHLHDPCVPSSRWVLQELLSNVKWIT